MKVDNYKFLHGFNRLFKSILQHLKYLKGMSWSAAEYCYFGVTQTNEVE